MARMGTTSTSGPKGWEYALAVYPDDEDDDDEDDDEDTGGGDVKPGGET